MMRTKNTALWKEHTSIVNRILDLIEERPETEWTLESLAAEVAVSPYYMHRMVTKITGESLHRHIIRSRIQRAVHDLVYAHSVSISEIACRCGYSSPAVFSRAFKHEMGDSPERFRERHSPIKSNICKVEDKHWERYFMKNPYNESVKGSMEGSSYRLRVAIRELPAKDIGYIRHFGPRHYARLDMDVETSLYELSQLATRMDLWTSGTCLIGIPRYSLADVPSLQIGYDACLTVPRPDAFSGEIGTRKLPGGKYAVLHLEEPADSIEPLVRIMLGSWLPESGYEYAWRPTMMISYNNPRSHPEGRWIVDVCLPIQ